MWPWTDETNQLKCSSTQESIVWSVHLIAGSALLQQRPRPSEPRQHPRDEKQADGHHDGENRELFTRPGLGLRHARHVSGGEGGCLLQPGHHAHYRRRSRQLQGDLQVLQLGGQPGTPGAGRYAGPGVHLRHRQGSAGRSGGQVDGLRQSRIFRASFDIGGS